MQRVGHDANVAPNSEIAARQKLDTFTRYGDRCEAAVSVGQVPAHADIVNA